LRQKQIELVVVGWSFVETAVSVDGFDNVVYVESEDRLDPVVDTGIISQLVPEYPGIHRHWTPLPESSELTQVPLLRHKQSFG
jgi:hypothetical protein